MSIEKFTTEGIILNKYDSGESDAVFKIYTRDFGTITAKQASLKKSVKLRPHLMQFRVVNVTVVRGRELYRIAGARESEINKIKSELMPHLCQLINRFLAYEVKNSKLYDRLIQYIKKSELDIAMLRLCVLADIMIVSGYMDTEKINMTLSEYKESGVDDIYMKVVMNKPDIVQNLRTSIEASML